MHMIMDNLPAATKIYEGRVGADGDHGAGDPLAWLQRLLGLSGRCLFEQFIDGDSLHGRSKVGLEILIEIGPQVGHRHPLLWRQDIGKR